jgi:hypothetical protein
VRLTAGAPVPHIDLPAVRYLFIDGSEGGYVVVPRSVPAGSHVRLLKPSDQSSNPRPGLSLVLLLVRATRWSSISLDVTLAPARDAGDAAAVVERL